MIKVAKEKTYSEMRKNQQSKEHQTDVIFSDYILRLRRDMARYWSEKPIQPQNEELTMPDEKPLAERIEDHLQNSAPHVRVRKTCKLLAEARDWLCDIEVEGLDVPLVAPKPNVVRRGRVVWDDETPGKLKPEGDPKVTVVRPHQKLASWWRQIF